MSSLAEVAKEKDDKRFTLYKEYALGLISKQDRQGLDDLMKHLMSKETIGQFGRTYIVPELIPVVCNFLIDEENKLEVNLDLDDLLPLAKSFVEIVKPKADEFADGYFACCKLLANTYQALGMYREAADARGYFNFGTLGSKCSVSGEERLDWYLVATELYLKKSVEESGYAAQMHQKATAVQREFKITNKDLLVRLAILGARVADQTQNFLAAANRYLELSEYPPSKFLTPKAIESAVSSAVTCSILAPISANRARVLARLYSDARAETTIHFPILQKIFFGRIIRPQEIEEFEKTLESHMKAMKGSRTVVRHAMMEHNIFACSNLYSNIRFEQLAKILGCTPAEAEELTGQMVEQKKIAVSIDQVDNLIIFEKLSSAVTRWDKQIYSVCQDMSALCDKLGDKYGYKLK